MSLPLPLAKWFRGFRQKVRMCLRVVNRVCRSSNSVLRNVYWKRSANLKIPLSVCLNLQLAPEDSARRHFAIISQASISIRSDWIYYVGYVRYGRDENFVSVLKRLNVWSWCKRLSIFSISTPLELNSSSVKRFSSVLFTVWKLNCWLQRTGKLKWFSASVDSTAIFYFVYVWTNKVFWD